MLQRLKLYAVGISEGLVKQNNYIGINFEFRHKSPTHSGNQFQPTVYNFISPMDTNHLSRFVEML